MNKPHGTPALDARGTLTLAAGLDPAPVSFPAARCLNLIDAMAAG